MKCTPRTMMVLALAATLVACGSVEDRINKAIPVGSEVESAKTALEKASQDAGLKDDFEAQYRGQLKLRALECSNGYTPSMFASIETIRAEVGNAECFVAADGKLAQWLGLRHAGLLAGMPPLRPVPAQPPSMVVGTDRIREAAVAEQAGVALLQVGNRHELIDLNGGKTIRMGERSGGKPMLSPNGRLILAGTDREAWVLDAENGGLLATLADVPSGSVYWASDKGLILTVDQKSYFQGWTSQSRTALPLDSRRLTGVVPVPDMPDTLVLLSNGRATRLKLGCSEKACAPEVLQEAKLTASGIRAAGLARVGNDVYFSGGTSLGRLRLDTLQNKSVSLAPMYLTDVIATHDPDQLILKGGISGLFGNADFYLYSIKNQTLAKVDTDALLSNRLFYAAPFGGTVSIDGSKLAAVKQLPTAPAEPLEAAISALQVEAQAARLEMLDRVQALRAEREVVGSGNNRRPYSTGVDGEATPVTRSFPPGEAGLVEAIRAGVLRPGNSGDVDAWKRSYLSHTGRSPNREFDDHTRAMKVYVITGDMSIPAQLTGANAVVFVLDTRAPFPRGSAGHSLILDMKSGSCSGAICGMYMR